MAGCYRCCGFVQGGVCFACGRWQPYKPEPDPIAREAQRDATARRQRRQRANPEGIEPRMRVLLMDDHLFARETVPPSPAAVRSSEERQHTVANIRRAQMGLPPVVLE